MTAFTPSRVGDVNQGGSDTSQLFLKLFGGEVLTSFEIATIMSDKVMMRTIPNGKSASFPVIGRTTAALHTVGADILGNAINHNEKVITIDGLTIAHASIASIDDAMNHYDVRSSYSVELGRALARTMDSYLQQCVILAARASANLSDSGYPGGTVQTNAAYSTTGATLAGGIYDAAMNLDENNVPAEDRYASLRPAQYYLLAQTSQVLDSNIGGRGSYAEGNVPMVAGVKLVKNNLTPNTNVTTGPTAYRGNFSTTVGTVWHKGAVGCVKLMDLSTEMEWMIKNQVWLMVAKYATGYGILRPESAVELKTS